MGVIKEIHMKNLTLVSHLSRSLEVMGTDTYRSATYDFLLMFHSNHGVSRTVSEINSDFN